MATKNDAPPPAPAADGGGAPKKKLGKILLIAGIVLVLLIGAGGAAFFMLSKNHAAEGEDGETVAAEEKPKKKKADKKKDDHKPSYSALDPFTVNLSSDAGDQYLQVALTLDMEDASSAENTKTFMAKIRNDIMLHLSGKKPAELASKEGKQQLAVELRTLINNVLDPDTKKQKDPATPVREVLFTSFIIQ